MFSGGSTDVQMRYHDLPGDDTPIVFIHGLGCAGSFDYPEVASQPCLAGHRRILVDLVGSGFSDKPTDFDYSIESHARYLDSFLTRIGADSIICYGHSAGGAVALSLAALRPERIAAIIVAEANLDSGGGFISCAIASHSQSEFYDSGFSAILANERATGNTTWAASYAVSSPIALYAESMSLIEGVEPSWRQILYKLTCPKTAIFGARSLPDPDTEELAAHNVEIDIVPNAGHSMAWENPQGLAEAISRNLTGIPYTRVRCTPPVNLTR